MLTDKLLRSWIRCRRKAWLDRHGDRKERLWTAHPSLQLEHEKKSFEAFLTSNPGRGLQGCKEGHSEILGITLKDELSNGQLIKVHAPLLQRTSGKSVWGEFRYRPVLSRQGKRTTKEIRQALALTAILLENLQESSVPNGIVVSKTNHGLEIDKVLIHESLKKQLRRSLLMLGEDLIKPLPPPITSDRKKCSVCSWQSLCNSEAKSIGDLSEISGIGHRRREILKEIGIHKIIDLANCTPSKLSKQLTNYENQTETLAKQLVLQAKAQINQKAKRINHTETLPEISSAPGILIYDIESDSDAKEDFLHGFISIKRNNFGKLDVKDAKYHPILMLYQDNEIKRWSRLKRKLNNYHEWPILHYGETEAIAIKKIAKQQLTSKLELEKLEGRFIDIHLRVRQHWVLPVRSYGLKTIADWIGFKWSQTNPDGALALLWWRQWKNNPEKNKRNSKSIDKILTYNKDDCLATWAVAKWLIDQDR